MTIEYPCFGKKNMRPKEWTGTIKSFAERTDGIEMEIDARGSYFHVLVGRHRYGNYICVPNWGIGTELSRLNDRFWNLERITHYYPKIHLVDANSIVDGLVALSKVATKAYEE